MAVSHFGRSFFCCVCTWSSFVPGNFGQVWCVLGFYVGNPLPRLVPVPVLSIPYGAGGVAMFIERPLEGGIVPLASPSSLDRWTLQRRMCTLSWSQFRLGPSNSILLRSMEVSVWILRRIGLPQHAPVPCIEHRVPPIASPAHGSPSSPPVLQTLNPRPSSPFRSVASPGLERGFERGSSSQRKGA